MNIEKLTKLVKFTKHVSVGDSPASDIVREIKSKYPQVQIQQISKNSRYSNGKVYHLTTLEFKNYPGSDATRNFGDPRIKVRNNWEDFLRYIYQKYVPGVDKHEAEMNITPSTLWISEDIKKDSVKDASKQEVERAINNLGYKVKRWTEYKGDVSAHVDPRDVDNDGYEYFNKQVKKLKQYAKDIYADGNEIVFFQAKFSAKDSVKDTKTAQGYEVEKIIKSKSGRLYCIMNRKVDYAIGAGYNQQRGDWDQGYYGYTSLDQALKALPGVMKRAGEVMDAVKDEDEIIVAVAISGNGIKEFKNKESYYKFAQLAQSNNYQAYLVPKKEYASLKALRNANFAFNRLHGDRKTRRFDSVKDSLL